MERAGEDTYVLNVDVSALQNPSMAGFGGVVCNFEGRFILGFYGPIGHSQVLYIEILALLHGLEFCWNAGIRKLAYFSDSLHTISLLQQDTLVHHHFSNELEMIKRLMRIAWDCSLQHILCEGNSCADFLAKKGLSSQERLVILEDPLSGMQQLLLADALGVRFTRI